MYNRDWMYYRALSPFRYIVRKVANKILPKTIRRCCSESAAIDEIIVSLTSFPGRINEVWKVVCSIKNQTILPGKIVLWLSSQQFVSKKDLPDDLLRLEDNIFEIRMVDEDIRSHKKYYYVMQEYSDKIVITFDDDVWYHPKTIESLYKTYQKYPEAIISNYTSQLKYANNKLLPYKEWKSITKPYEDFNLVQIGVGGVLYPPNIMSDLLFRDDVFMKIAPLADDLWLNAIARLNHVPVVHSSSRIIVLPIDIISPSLCDQNNGMGMNDIQLNRIRDYLTNAYGVDPYASNFVVNYKNL